MIPNNMPELQTAFDDWMSQGDSPTNGDMVRHDNIDVELLHYLATFIWMRAGGYVSSEAYSQMMKEWGEEIHSTPETALDFLVRAGAIVKVDK